MCEYANIRYANIRMCECANIRICESAANFTHINKMFKPHGTLFNLFVTGLIAPSHLTELSEICPAIASEMHFFQNHLHW